MQRKQRLLLMPNIIQYTQEDFNKDVDFLVDQISKADVKYDLIVGLARGGLLPGVTLSHKLGVPFMAVNWSKTHQEPNKYVWESVINGKMNVLIVDDMVDSGELLVQLFESFESWADWDDLVIDTNRIGLAVLINNTDVPNVYSNSTGVVEATYVATEISRKLTPEWIEYWWERK